ncbi:uncharacterized protein PAC_03759 [Phialocephala subalpina]|uniref:Ubiquitin-conjugating enzyme E2C-binding protein n=1 Tax=Phialocephala subalpina TaxID=576137 RepID=A0A1L7WM86_9HELO|nr:uncharacterized protein PAC_03759 [Phialocephala subalpina]
MYSSRMAQPKVLLYAELLPNIRQISVMVALDQPCYTSTKGLLSADGRHIVLTHGGENYTLSLPEQAIPTAQLQKPVVGSKELSWRLPVAGLSSQSSVEFVQSNDAPWPAKDLGSSSEFSCRKCGAVIVQKDVVKSWRDLPSENWAEMMDFWHCHKPEDRPDVETNGENSHAGHNHTSDPNANRAYGANTKFIAQSGIGFVDLTSFLLVDSDCQNLQTVSHGESSSRLPTLSCKSCQSSIGYFDTQSCGVRLHKWSLSSSSIPGPPSLVAPPISTIISAKLLSILRAQVSSKILLIPETSSSSQTLHLWVLQQSLFYSTSESSTGSQTFAMKVLWKHASKEETKALLDNEKAEDTTLPDDAVKEIETCLRESARCLPPSSRLFQGWNVSLLERYLDE